MPASTPKFGIQYPASSDKVADFPTTSKNAATTIDQALGNLSDNKVIIGGQVYQRTGVITQIPSYTFTTVISSIYGATLAIPHPYSPPDGYGFRYWVAYSTGYTYGETVYQAETKTDFRIIQINSNSKVMTKIGWELVKTS